MSDTVFREKSINRIKSPENLDDYIRVTSPGLWLLIAGIVVLLAGFAVWVSLGTITTKTYVPAIVYEGNASCQADDELIESVKNRLDMGEEIRFKICGREGVVTEIDEDGKLIIGEIELKNCSDMACIYEDIKPISLFFK